MNERTIINGVDYTPDPSAKCRYLMYNKDDRSQWWRLDVENDGERSYIWANGRPMELKPETRDNILLALTALDTAFGAAMQEDKGFQSRKLEHEL
jgi:hypothetical protein